MEVARPNSYGTAQLARLNRELDDLYELKALMAKAAEALNK